MAAVDNVCSNMKEHRLAVYNKGRALAKAKREVLLAKPYIRTGFYAKYSGRPNIGRFDFMLKGYSQDWTPMAGSPITLPPEADWAVVLPVEFNSAVCGRGFEWRAFVHFGYRVYYQTVLKLFKSQGAFSCKASSISLATIRAVESVMWELKRD